MTTTGDIRRVLPRNSYAASIDIKDAYWHIPMSSVVRSLLGFRVENRCYRYRAMLFGLNIAPRIFTKVMSSVIDQLRRKGININGYLEDLLLWAESPEVLRQDLRSSVEFLTKLGLCINEIKSNLVPSQEFLYLGLLWNTVDYSVVVP